MQKAPSAAMAALAVALGLAMAGSGLVMAGPAQAQTINCADPKNTVEMGACAERELTAADKRLNDAYQRLMKDERRDENARKLLRDAQRKWIPFRDAECGFIADEMRGGTGQPVLLMSCLARLTAERADALEQALQSR